MQTSLNLLACSSCSCANLNFFRLFIYMYRHFLIIWVFDLSVLNLLEKINLNLLGLFILFICIVVGFEVDGFWFFGNFSMPRNSTKFSELCMVGLNAFVAFLCFWAWWCMLGSNFSRFDYFVGNQFVDCVRIFWVWSWVVGYVLIYFLIIVLHVLLYV